MIVISMMKQLAFRSAILLLIKIIGAVVRIPLFRFLGAEGVGLYQMIYSLYGLLLTIVTGGLPVTITLWTAKDQRKALQMLKAAVILLTIFGVIAGLLAHALAVPLADLLGDRRLVWSIRFMTPAIVLVPLLSLVRGYLQGLEGYEQIAVSELIEQVFRVFTMILLVSLWIKHSIGLAVGGAVFGAVIGAWTALAYLLLVIRRHAIRSYKRSAFSAIKRPDKATFLTFIWLLRLSASITVSRLIIPLSDFIDALIIPHRLQHAGVTNEQAIAIFGIFTGMAASIVYLPTFISAAVSHIFTAKMTKAWKSGSHVQFQAYCRILIQQIWLWGLGCSLFLYGNHEQLSNVLYGSNTVSKAIMYLSLAPLISGMRDLTTTILWAADRKKEPMYGLLLGIVVASALGYALVGQASISIIGIACELLALEGMAVIWNIRTLKHLNANLFAYKQMARDSILMLLIVGISFFISEQWTIWGSGFEGEAYFKMIMSFCLIFSFVLIRSWLNLKRNLFIT